MDSFAIGVNSAHAEFAMFILKCLRLHITFSTPGFGLLVRIISIIYPKGNDLYPISMFGQLLRDRVVRK